MKCPHMKKITELRSKDTKLKKSLHFLSQEEELFLLLVVICLVEVAVDGQGVALGEVLALFQTVPVAPLSVEL